MHDLRDSNPKVLFTFQFGSRIVPVLREQDLRKSPPLPFSQANLFFLFVFTFLSISAWFALLSSAVCAAVGCWESVAGLFCPLASADVANNCQVRRASRGGVVKTIQISFSFTTPHREDTNPACVASFASCFLFPHPESFSRYMLATTHSRTPRSCLLSFNARIRTLKGRMISFGCGHVKFTSFFCVCVTCST